ncbi:S8 family serine peptidase [Anaerostipes sp.]|uniref:S8 family serine peptidase n=1 Tax=Anaerostipes sp. TaxID=1872530 RepID=UPI0025BF2C56|nr:S8 family serine peptidase [Anaerostipes sp.]MBS7007107.1 S8 family serine peptidase [Anaerostipes sp.]
MRKAISMLTAACLAGSLIFVQPETKTVRADETESTSVSVTDPNEYKTKEVIVKFKDNVSETKKENIIDEAPGDAEQVSGNVAVVKADTKKETAAAVKQLDQNDDVEYVQPNYVYRLVDGNGRVSEKETAMKTAGVNDPFFYAQWGIYNYGTNLTDYVRAQNGGQGITIPQKKGLDINVKNLWKQLNKKNTRNVIVANIDTGIDYTSKDLKSVMWKNPKEKKNGKDSDKNGYKDDIYGWNFYDNNNKVFSNRAYSYSFYEDDHGTHGAGTIAAVRNNGYGIAGIASGTNVKIMAIKALGGRRGEGTTLSVIKGIKYAKKMGAKICNFSFGSYQNDKMLRDLIKESKDMLFICAAGNERNNNDRYPAYPASYNYSNVVSVANLDYTGSLESSSNYGKKRVLLAAPGTDILSLGVDERGLVETGTSMAAPMVTGTAALIYAKYPGITPSMVKNALKRGASRISSLNGKVASGGYLNAEKTVNSNYYPPYITVKTAQKKNYSLARVSAKKRGSAAVTAVKYIKGKKTSAYFSNGKKGYTIKNGTIKVKKTGYYTIYARDSAGNQTVKTVKITAGKPPKLKVKVYKKNRTKAKVQIKVSDESKKTLKIRYAKGKKAASYFKQGKKGKKLKNKKGSASFQGRRGKYYTVYITDQCGNEKIKKVKI